MRDWMRMGAGEVGGLPAGHVAATNRVMGAESVHCGDVEYPPVGKAPHLPLTVELTPTPPAEKRNG